MRLSFTTDVCRRASKTNEDYAIELPAVGGGTELVYLIRHQQKGLGMGADHAGGGVQNFLRLRSLLNCPVLHACHVGSCSRLCLRKASISSRNLIAISIASFKG